jgi:hypothetical protein
VRCITWDTENCCANEFKFADQNKTITKTTSYGVATARSKYLFVPSGRKYVFEVKVNFRRPNFFYGIGFIDKEIGFNFMKAAYPKVSYETANAEIQEKKYELQWFYWYQYHPLQLILTGLMATVGIYWDHIQLAPRLALSFQRKELNVQRTQTQDSNNLP